MDITHDMLVGLSKSWGLFYLIGFAVVVTIYAFWPSNRARFHAAKNDILDQDDKPWR
ncbi:cbb3-type cytochrome c oxidase subunit 3 [Mesorhizobium sp. CN5-321]|jgi:cytochrome c oxidase cbb3-type subunit 4|uniref:cbb3-type cytochrome c oxidase subunit 3 n=1 Tax=Mesorhizobium hunchu TaxID=3157708 RepID=UPI0032B8427E